MRNPANSRSRRGPHPGTAGVTNRGRQWCPGPGYSAERKDDPSAYTHRIVSVAYGCGIVAAGCGGGTARPLHADRKSVVCGKRVPLSFDVGGCRFLKKQTQVEI